MQGKEVNTESYSQEIFTKYVNIITPVETCKVWWRTRRPGNDSPCWYVSHEASQHRESGSQTYAVNATFSSSDSGALSLRFFDLFNTSFISSNTVVNAANVSIYCSEFVPVDTSSRDRIFQNVFLLKSKLWHMLISQQSIILRHCTNECRSRNILPSHCGDRPATTDKLIFVYFLQNFVGLSESRAYTLHRVCFRPRVHQRSWSQNYQRSDFHVRCGHETIPTAIDANIALSIVCICSQIKLSNHDMNDTKLWYMRWFRRNF
jgi:hypothetical protein